MIFRCHAPPPQPRLTCPTWSNSRQNLRPAQRSSGIQQPAVRFDTHNQHLFTHLANTCSVKGGITLRIAVLGASGRVGGLLVDQAGDRGHRVVALVRAPDRFTRPASRQVEIRQADVTSPQGFPALDDIDALVSAIGVRKGDGPGALVAGARVLADYRRPLLPPRISRATVAALMQDEVESGRKSGEIVVPRL
jgi:hypothetical protein